MKDILLKTSKKREIIDITDLVNDRILVSSLKEGLVSLFLTHTTAALTTADLDPGTDLDILDAFEELVPKLNYRHPHNPEHVPDHILSALIGCSLVLPFKKGKCILGTWQRVVLVELDGPRERNLVVNFL